MDMAACNNCSLKEKEQVYTAARDGNHVYLKVSRDEKDFQRLTSPLPKPAFSDEFLDRTLNIFDLFILVRFLAFSVDHKISS